MKLLEAVAVCKESPPNIKQSAQIIAVYGSPGCDLRRPPAATCIAWLNPPGCDQLTCCAPSLKGTDHPNPTWNPCSSDVFGASASYFGDVLDREETMRRGPEDTNL